MFKNIKNYTPETPEISRSKILWWGIAFFTFSLLLLVLQVIDNSPLKNQNSIWESFFQILYIFIFVLLFTAPLLFRKYSRIIIILGIVLSLIVVFGFFFQKPSYTPWIIILGPVYAVIYIIFPLTILFILMVIQNKIILKQGLPQKIALIILILLMFANIIAGYMFIVDSRNTDNIISNYDALQKEELYQGLELCQISTYFTPPNYELVGVCLNNKPYFVSKKDWYDATIKYLVNRLIRGKIGEYFLQDSITREIEKLNYSFSLPDKTKYYYLNFKGQACLSPAGTIDLPFQEINKAMELSCPKQ